LARRYALLIPGRLDSSCTVIFEKTCASELFWGVVVIPRAHTRACHTTGLVKRDAESAVAADSCVVGQDIKFFYVTRTLGAIGHRHVPVGASYHLRTDFRTTVSDSFCRPWLLYAPSALTLKSLHLYIQCNCVSCLFPPKISSECFLRSRSRFKCSI
jgi:hypothetical protein